MPTFRFNAVDAEGMLKDGTVLAANKAEARERLQDQGLKVRDLEEVGSPDEVGNAAPESSIEFVARTREWRKPPRGFPFGFLTFLLMLATAGYVLYRDPPWGRLAYYNISTPEGMFRTELEIEANNDYKAAMELRAMRDKDLTKKRLASLTVSKTAQADGRTVLFVRFVEPVKKDKIRQVVWYEKDVDTGLWEKSQEPFELERLNKKLFDDIRAWQKRESDD